MASLETEVNRSGCAGGSFWPVISNQLGNAPRQTPQTLVIPSREAAAVKNAACNWPRCQLAEFGQPAAALAYRAPAGGDGHLRSGAIAIMSVTPALHRDLSEDGAAVPRQSELAIAVLSSAEWPTTRLVCRCPRYIVAKFSAGNQLSADTS